MFDDRLYITGKYVDNVYFIRSLLNLANVLNSCLPFYIDLGYSKPIKSQILNLKYYKLEDELAIKNKDIHYTLFII